MNLIKFNSENAEVVKIAKIVKFDEICEISECGAVQKDAIGNSEKMKTRIKRRKHENKRTTTSARKTQKQNKIYKRKLNNASRHA